MTVKFLSVSVGAFSIHAFRGLTIQFSLLTRHQLRRCIPRFLARHILYILNRPRRVVLFLISQTDQILQAFTARLYCSNGNFIRSNNDYSIRVFEKGPPPTARTHAPRTDEDASFHGDHPNPDDAVSRVPAGADAEDLSLVDSREYLI